MSNAQDRNRWRKSHNQVDIQKRQPLWWISNWKQQIEHILGENPLNLGPATEEAGSMQPCSSSAFQSHFNNL